MSPHFFNPKEDIDQLISVLEVGLQSASICPRARSWLDVNGDKPAIDSLRRS